jgi:hypothetical protein
VKIEFKKDQFETLLKLIYLGNWMANAYEEDPQNNEFSELVSYICEFAKDIGLEDMVKCDDETGISLPSGDFEENEHLNELIERYDDAVFLDKLIFNLAGKDMLDKFGEKKITSMTDEEFFKEEGAFMQKYQKEFAKNGIQNLTVKMEKPAAKKPAKKKS